LLKIGT